VTNDSGAAPRARESKLLAGNQDRRETIEEKPRAGIDDDEDEIEEEKIRRSCRALGALEIARRPSWIDAMGKSTGAHFFRKMRFPGKFSDGVEGLGGKKKDKKFPQRTERHGLSSLIGLPNGEIWRARAMAISLAGRVDIFIFSKIARPSFDFAAGRD